MSPPRPEPAEPDPVEPGAIGPGDFVLEDAEEALLDGDRTIEVGPVRSALRNRQFRIVYVGSVLSNTGTWMQNVVNAAFAYNLTGSAAFVGVITFAYLGPQLLLSLVGGALADTFERRRIIIVMAVWQMVFSVVLAGLAASGDPAPAALFAVTFLIGSGNALQNPTFQSLLPNLVPRRDLSGAISLNSANMNLSRIVGPAIGGVLYANVGASWVFLANAATFVFIIVAMARIRVPRLERHDGEPTGLRRVLEGFAVVRRDPVVRKAVSTIAIYSFFSLTFVTQMPVIAEETFGIPSKSTAYGVLYAVFGVGALAGALSIGTVFANRSLERILRWSLAGFAFWLLAFGLVQLAPLAFPIAVILGFFYFATVTSLSTILQHRLDDRVRGRVLAVWMMAFGGTVPIGGLIAGWVAENSDVTVIVIVGAIVAAFLVWFADLRDPAERTSPTVGQEG